LPASLAYPAGKLLGRIPLHRRSAAGLAARVLRGARSPAGTRYLTWTSDRLHERDKHAAWNGPPVEATEGWIESLVPGGLSALDTQLALDLQINLLSQLLVKMDIATMAHSIEGRSPFLDHKLAEFVASVPDNFRLRGRTPKSLLRDAYRDRLPAEVTSGRKRGFEIPLETWLQTDLRDVLHDTVGSPAALVRDWLDGRFVDGVLTRSVLAERNWPTLTYSLLVLELWLREFRASQAAQPAAVCRAA
jgi:asparagine synthase (glutamine-hydrolysing)